MAWQRPTLQDLIGSAMAAIKARLPSSSPMLRRSMLGVIAHMHAGAMHGLYGYQAWVSRQMLVDTADADMLDRHASIWQVTRKAASAATGFITISGTAGSSIAMGSIYRRNDGRQYHTTAPAPATVAASGTVDVAVVDTGTGKDGNIDGATYVNAVTPIAGVNKQAIVGNNGITGGVDSETDQALRQRIINIIQQPPHGGSVTDYTNWALSIAAVTRAWVYPLELGAGTVVVRVVTDGAVGGLIPSSSVIAAVQAYTDQVKPVTARVSIVAPVAKLLNLTVRLRPNDAATHASVQAEISDMLTRNATPSGTIYRSHIDEAISQAAGEIDHTLLQPMGDVVHGVGEIAVLGAITWL